MQQKYYLERLRGMLGYKRLQHSLGVSDTSVRLAGLYGANRDKAAIAGLLHDCARDLPDEELLEIARQNRMPIDDVEESMPVLLHAPVGAMLARQQLGVQDEAVLRAIALHTLGDDTMTLLDKIIFVADKAEPGRVYPGVQELRELMWQNLDRALLWCLEAAIKLSAHNGRPIHPKTLGLRLKITLPDYKVAVKSFLP